MEPSRGLGREGFCWETTAGKFVTEKWSPTKNCRRNRIKRRGTISETGEKNSWDAKSSGGGEIVWGRIGCATKSELLGSGLKP